MAWKQGGLASTHGMTRVCFGFRISFRRISNCKMKIANFKFAILNLQFAIGSGRGSEMLAG
jgi:hypothetical protein